MSALGTITAVSPSGSASWESASGSSTTHPWPPSFTGIGDTPVVKRLKRG